MKDINVIFLDTNVYIIGTADLDSPEAKILAWAGEETAEGGKVEVVVSDELFEQILRVSRRLQNKDWGGEILARIWHDFRLRYVLIDLDRWKSLADEGIIPREDVGIYLAAVNGKTEIFISSNHELIRELSRKTGDFLSMTPGDFLQEIQPDDPQENE